MLYLEETVKKRKLSPLRPVTEIEWTLIWSSMRYFMGRQTIAASTYPSEIMTHYYKRLQPYQKEMLANDLRGHSGQFGDKAIDEPIWKKFAAALDTPRHFIIKHKRKTHTCFEANDRVYDLKQYLKEPGKEIFFDPSFIKLIRAIKKI